MVDLYHGPSYSHLLIPYWNATIRLVFFLLMVLVIRINERLRLHQHSGEGKAAYG